MEIVHDEARVVSFFYGGRDLGLMPINKLEQLRKHIFDIERIQFEEVSKKLLDLIKLFRSEVYHAGIHRL